jgi:hypothetical protein
MKIKTSEATPKQLDWLVHQAWCEGACHDEPFPSYSTDWAQGGPIIEREKISTNSDYNGAYPDPWLAESYAGGVQQTGPTPLIAAMRCYCASKLGDEVDVPEELT